MPQAGVKRFIWCGGGSNLLEDDVITFGARFVQFFASTFMGLRHRDKQAQLKLLDESRAIEWMGGPGRFRWKGREGSGAWQPVACLQLSMRLMKEIAQPPSPETLFEWMHVWAHEGVSSWPRRGFDCAISIGQREC